MWGRKRIALIIVVVVVAIVVVLIILLMGRGSWDYFPPHGTLEVQRTADNAVTFTIDGEVWGVDGPVRFDNCAIDFRINDTRVGPNDHRFGGGDWYVRTTDGCGYLNASVFTDGLVIYVVVLSDVDSDGEVSEGDTISLISTEPLNPETLYSIFFITELHSSWSPGTFHGEYIT